MANNVGRGSNTPQSPVGLHDFPLDPDDVPPEDVLNQEPPEGHEGWDYWPPPVQGKLGSDSYSKAIKERMNGEFEGKNRLAHAILDTWDIADPRILKTIARDVKQFHKIHQQEVHDHNSAWDELARAMGVGTDNRRKDARDFKKAMANGADEEDKTIRRNFDKALRTAFRTARWIFSGNEANAPQELLDFIQGGKMEQLPVHHPQILQEFWNSRHPEYSEMVQRINDGHMPFYEWEEGHVYHPEPRTSWASAGDEWSPFGTDVHDFDPNYDSFDALQALEQIAL